VIWPFLARYLLAFVAGYELARGSSLAALFFAIGVVAIEAWEFFSADEGTTTTAGERDASPPGES
jgi:hypothetical protein